LSLSPKHTHLVACVLPSLDQRNLLFPKFQAMERRRKCTMSQKNRLCIHACPIPCTNAENKRGMTAQHAPKKRPLSTL
jgi:hypothetical protein